MQLENKDLAIFPLFHTLSYKIRSISNFSLTFSSFFQFPSQYILYTHTTSLSFPVLPPFCLKYQPLVVFQRAKSMLNTNSVGGDASCTAAVHSLTMCLCEYTSFQSLYECKLYHMWDAYCPFLLQS